MEKHDTRPTIQDVAQIAGVSTATVSRTLQKPELVREKTRIAVQDAVRKTGYRINSAAQNLRRNRAGSVLVIVPDIGNTFFSEILLGIEQIASEAGYTILIGDASKDGSRTEGLMDFLRNGKADGALLLNGYLPDQVINGLPTSDGGNIPVISVCEAVPAANIAHVGIDNKAAAKAAVDHLIAQGHQKIAHLSGPESNILTRLRIKGYEAAMHEAGLSDHISILPGDFSIQSGIDVIAQLLDKSARPTALFCANDEMAMGAAFGLTQAGLKVPDDLSLMGFDDIQFARTFIPPISTIHQPRSEIGKLAMHKLLKILNSEAITQEHSNLEFSLIQRESVRKIQA